MLSIRMGITVAVAALTVAITVLPVATSAHAAGFPDEIHGTVAGFKRDGGLNTSWTGTLRLKRLKRDPITRQPPAQPTYLPAPGSTVSWMASLKGGCRGQGSGALDAKALDGALTIGTQVDPRFPKLGHTWDMTIKALAPDGGQMRMPVSGACPSDNGLDTPVRRDAADGSTFGYNGYDLGGRHPENRHTRDLKTFKGRGQATDEFGNQHWEWDLRAKGGLEARPRTRSITRAGSATLDGSASARRSRIEKYVWTFAELPGACPDGAAPVSDASRTGRVVKIVALCGLKVTLTVSDGAGDSDTATTVLEARPRKGPEWRTPFSHRERPKGPDTPTDPPSVTSMGGGNYAFSFFGGMNVSDCGRASAASVILCPKLSGTRSWLDRGYELKRVSDPDGPFDGQYYVVEPSLRVERAALINPTILPGSDFFRDNLAVQTDVAGFLLAVRQHEGLGNGQARSGHSGILKDLVGRDPTNPRRAVEAVFGPGRTAVAARADRRLHDVDKVLDKESDDPLAHIWTGALEVYDAYQRRWIRGEGIAVPGNSARGRG